MIINLIKFIHVLLALGLLGLTGYCVTLTHSKYLSFFNKKILVISLFTLLTGSLLIYPKHFTIHTPWIQAAYLLLFIYGLIIALSIRLSKSIPQLWIWRILYIILVFVLILITHDAVTKRTFLAIM